MLSLGDHQFHYRVGFAAVFIEHGDLEIMLPRRHAGPGQHDAGFRDAGLQARRVVAQVAGLTVAALLIGGVKLLGLSMQHFIASVMLGLLAMTAGYGWWLWRYRRGYGR